MSENLGPQKPRGRPAYEPSPEACDMVKVLLAMGWTSLQIADALGISLATLKRHFRAELQERGLMRDRVEAERLAALYALAKAGRIGAIRELGRELEAAAAPGQVPSQGKKQQRQEAAGRVADRPGGRFSTPAPPIGKKAAAERAALTAGHGTAWGDDLITPIFDEETDHDD